MAEYLYPSKQGEMNSSDDLSIEYETATENSRNDTLSISSKESSTSYSLSEESMPMNDGSVISKHTRSGKVVN